MGAKARARRANKIEQRRRRQEASAERSRRAAPTPKHPRGNADSASAASGLDYLDGPQVCDQCLRPIVGSAVVMHVTYPAGHPDAGREYARSVMCVPCAGAFQVRFAGAGYPTRHLAHGELDALDAGRPIVPVPHA